MNNDFEFSINSKAQLYEAGLIGGKAIAIIPAFDGAPAVKSGDFLATDVKPGLTELVNQRLTPLQEKIEIMMVNADSLLINLNDVFDVKTKKNIQRIRFEHPLLVFLIGQILKLETFNFAFNSPRPLMFNSFLY